MIRELEAADTRLAHAAIAELRPHVRDDLDAFVAQINEAQRGQGYRLFGSFVPDHHDAVGVVGFRPVVSLAWGNVLYIDDLSVRAEYRGRGHGRSLLSAVETEAATLGAVAVHLDSGHQRYDAHRLYLAGDYQIRSHHFVRPLPASESIY